MAKKFVWTLEYSDWDDFLLMGIFSSYQRTSLAFAIVKRRLKRVGKLETHGYRYSIERYELDRLT